MSCRNDHAANGIIQWELAEQCFQNQREEADARKQMLPKEQPGKAIMSEVPHPIMYSKMISAKGFDVMDPCTGCGKYEAQCPLNNIKQVKG